MYHETQTLLIVVRITNFGKEQTTTSANNGQFSSSASSLIVLQLHGISVFSYRLEYSDEGAECIRTRLVMFPELDYPSHAHGRLLTISSGNALKIGWSKSQGNAYFLPLGCKPVSQLPDQLIKGHPRLNYCGTKKMYFTLKGQEIKKRKHDHIMRKSQLKNFLRKQTTKLKYVPIETTQTLLIYSMHTLLLYHQISKHVKQDKTILIKGQYKGVHVPR